ncbi:MULTISPECIES: C40 family peptidase [Streptomyces]|uniref:C40 family peptidase n=1 Tax=Streptomyces morookaense TaxID=1970 RepID=A0A7Y7EA40_STRMO|nr:MULTISPECIES: C40 family peptidase [Streptomyces]MCC2279753.1 C40 family peptidase [Streptomyces sp. ET3-23]NVK81119.1 C40 family peptidase [Streptomyces morookaense]GHF48726.1 glycoside hydrolase [Streptomyces morookaense]
MSPNAHITSHRKPRRPATQSWVVRTGVAGGVLSTLAVAGAGSATAVEKPSEATMEMPAFNAEISTSIAQSAVATQQAAVDYQVRAQVEDAIDHAKADAKKAKEEADRKAEAERKAAEQEQRDAEARASRSSDRGSLSTKSESSSSATGSTATLISFLEAQVGKAYVMGATGSSAYDCSGLVQAAYNNIGISLPRVSEDQSTAGTQVGLGNLQPGDILYWGSAGSAYHVAVYIGGGKFIGAQNPSSGVVERDLSYSPPTGAVRVL